MVLVLHKLHFELVKSASALTVHPAGALGAPTCRTDESSAAPQRPPGEHSVSEERGAQLILKHVFVGVTAALTLRRSCC